MMITKPQLLSNLSYCRSDIHVVVFICTPHFLLYFLIVWCFSLLQRDKTLTAVICSRSPDFHTSQTLTLFHKREDDIYIGQYSLSLHHL